MRTIYWFSAICLGLLLGDLGYKVRAHRQMHPPIPKPRAAPTLGSILPLAGVSPAPGPSHKGPELVRPTAIPGPSRSSVPVSVPRSRLIFPPLMLRCGSSDPSSELAAASEALKEGERQRASDLFEQAAVCGGQYALIVAKLFDPAQPMERLNVETDPRIAMHFYAYAAAQERASDVFERLNVLRDQMRDDKALVEEIDELRDAVRRSRS